LKKNISKAKVYSATFSIDSIKKEKEECPYKSIQTKLQKINEKKKEGGLSKEQRVLFYSSSLVHV